MNGFHTLAIHLVRIPKPRSPFDKVLLSIAEGLRANDKVLILFVVSHEHVEWSDHKRNQLV